MEAQQDYSTIPKPSSGPLDVHVGCYVESLGGFRASDMSFEVDMYFRVAWKDERHKWQSRPLGAANVNELQVLQDPNKISTIWKPDLYFKNAKSSQTQYIMTPNFAMYIDKMTGILSYSTRVQLTVACNMQLHRYPMDSQVCALKVASYGHTTEEMDVHWLSESPVVFAQDIQLPEFYVTEMTTESCAALHNYSVSEQQVRTGNFSCLEARVHVQRSLGYHIVQTYLPTTLIVTISWMAFWIAPQAVPARGTAIRFALPPVSYAKAIDFWYGACMLFLFAGLIEFALVSNWTRLAQKYGDLANGNQQRARRRQSLLNVFKRRQSSRDADEETGVAIDEKIQSVIAGSYRMLSDLNASKAMQADRCSRFLFPFTFIVLCAIYWAHFYFLLI
uniref:Uncharacterized protein n=1 Tax=Plectus sambesii TaxID=2011161 RepID=A0A914UXY7_9BILA